MDPTRSWVAGKPLQRALHHVQQDLEGQSYHVRNGAMGEAHVPSRLWLSSLLFLPAECFWGYFLL